LRFNGSGGDRFPTVELGSKRIQPDPSRSKSILGVMGNGRINSET
jgi:hypothetical protein